MKTALTELIERLEEKIKIYSSNNLERVALGMIEAKVIATELLEKENDNPHLGYKTALVPDELLKPQPQEKQEEVKCDQDNGLREALIDVQSLILDQGNYTYGAFNEMDHVKGILEEALNQNK